MVGELHLGKIGNGKEITAKAAIGFNPANPKDNYFFADINKLSIGAITEAFEIKTALPKALKDSGFPEGLIVGFSANPEGELSSCISLQYN